MEDSEQVVSSTTPSEDEMRSYRQFGNHYGNEATAKVGKDDILDLVGGAQDAIERHMASYPDDLKEFTEEAKEQLTKKVISDITPSDEEQEEEVTDTFSEAEPVIVNPLEADYLPELIRPDPPKAPQEEAPAPVVESAPVVEVLPEAAPEKEAIAAPPAPSRVLQRWNLDKRDEHFLPSTPLQPLMQFPKVVELLYWRDVKTSGVVFGASLSLLLSLTLCSIVSVSSYIGLALLSVTICFRIYKGILQAIQKSDEGHPFKLYLDQDVALSEETVHKYSDCVLTRFNTTVTELRRLFLVEDLVDSLKFAVLMWILTYVGALFNGLTLFILGLVGMFSCPIVYEKYKVQIDHYVGMANKQVKDIIATVQAKVPGLKRVKAE
ncbi:reticulon-4 isoform X1 [Salmo salar]|uniref:Reticulon n=1 Tax=Salmo salar TaxID=8030 RepID=A0A1S3N4I6_SALSA|nr:reticulon-4 isoform X1 [Salmo salar]|eukprot:XP_014010297.1 PREDICTED: reticulon-4 isoform X3 [Salmo salar]